MVKAVTQVPHYRGYCLQDTSQVILLHLFWKLSSISSCKTLEMRVNQAQVLPEPGSSLYYVDSTVGVHPKQD